MYLCVCVCASMYTCLCAPRTEEGVGYPILSLSAQSFEARSLLDPRLIPSWLGWGYQLVMWVLKSHNILIDGQEDVLIFRLMIFFRAPFRSLFLRL